jgi:uncharacterized protein
MVSCQSRGSEKKIMRKAHVERNQGKKAGGLSKRLHFPEDEQRFTWLPLLLDAYAVADTGVAIAIRHEEKKNKKKLACGKGCSNCCVYQKDLPLYPHELVGIYWYVSEKMLPPGRESLRDRLEKHVAGLDCPFLIEGSCSIHPVRPVGCRQFNVFATPCAAGEDPYFTRRNDVLTPIVEYTERAFAAVIPFYKMNKAGDISSSIKIIRSQIMNIQTYDWNKLVAIMYEADSRKSK